MTLVSILCPVYNEEDSIGPFMSRLLPALDTLPYRFELVFVDDGSVDGTLKALVGLSAEKCEIRILELTRNFGKEAALSCALAGAHGDAVIPIDVDLQDPPELIADLLAKWEEGNDVVLARRTDRDSDTFLKRHTATLFYRMHNRISDPPIPENVGDFRLMSREVVDVINRLPESQRFMKGLFAWAGFQQATVDYRREERSAGETSFNFWKLWNHAMQGITSFSTVPLRIWVYLGAVVSLLAFIFGINIVIQTLYYEAGPPGYASLMVSVSFLGGIQLIGIGVLGEYVGRIYLESKRRPPYVVKKEYRAGQSGDAE